MKQPFAIIALGSNLGDSEDLLRQAAVRLQEVSSAPVICSSFHKTDPVDCPPGSPAFLNAVAIIAPLPNESPESLLAKLQELERDFGRQPKRAHNEARPLDLDLIAFNEETRATSSLVLPHPRAHERGFVLIPLAEIAPDFRFPARDLSVGELAATLKR